VLAAPPAARACSADLDLLKRQPIDTCTVLLAERADVRSVGVREVLDCWNQSCCARTMRGAVSSTQDEPPCAPGARRRLTAGAAQRAGTRTGPLTVEPV
jgi:hypothetical protein